MTSTSIRPAVTADAAFILQCIKDLAEYEKALHEVKATETDLQATLFCQNPKAFALVIEANKQPVGFAVYFYNYSTWLGKHGIYIEDVYVQPQHRQHGLGTKVFQYLAQKAQQENCGRVEWWVLDWNEPAISFYKKIGAEAMTEWTVQRLTGSALNAMAATTNLTNAA